MLKREWGAESNGKLPHLFIPGKTAALVPEFAEEDLPSAELHLVPALAVKDLLLGRTHDDDDMYVYVLACVCVCVPVRL